MKSAGFFAELKRRNVYKVAIAYGIVAWLLIQVTSILFPTFGAPLWVMKVFIAMVVLGWPVALVLAWAFELTPAGIKRTEGLAPNETTAPRFSGRLVGILLTLTLIAVGLLIFQLSGSKARMKRIFGSTAIPAKSIAVLPFANLSNDPENAYFADGVQDEILTRLAKVAQLKVISRTSTLRFKSKPENLPEIAKQLGVMNILEGSVQKSNDQVRVNVQLINAAADSHLWAEIYDRKLTDLFAVESEIAKTIAETLRAKLTGNEKTAIAVEPTDSTAAHDLYLRGHYFAAKRTGEDLRRAIDFFNQAIAQDANYAQAYSGLAVSYILLPEYSDEPSANTIPKAREAAEKAIALDSNLAEAHVAMALVYHGAELDLEQADRELRRAIQLDPNYSNAHYFLAILVLNSLGRWLTRSFEERETGVIGNIGVDPSLDPLRSDPRFQELVQKVIGPKKHPAS